jgi:hypothetical protein
LHDSGKREPTLHLPNHQLLVQSVRPGEQEELPTSGFEELLGQAYEPVLPKGFRSGKIGSPCPLPLAGGGGGDGGAIVFDEQSGDGDARGGLIADGAGAGMPFDAGSKGGEGGRARGEVVFHATEGVEGGSLWRVFVLGIGKGEGFEDGWEDVRDATDLRQRRGRRSRVTMARAGACRLRLR